MSTTIKTLLFASAFAVACGDSDDNNPDRGLNSSMPGVDEITVDVTRDVGNNLAIHFGRAAGKPPVGATALRFDFNEISREVRDGEGVVTGDFLPPSARRSARARSRSTTLRVVRAGCALAYSK
ncbi:MAG: hypothetical protein VCF24_06440 [Candidatus Latescibacterota bacterium]